MTELEIMERAKAYVEKLARGINPITGEEVPEGDVINHVRVSRCLFYVADVLRQVIENGGIRAEPAGSEPRPQIARRSEKAAFALTLEQREQYDFGDRAATVSTIAQQLNGFIDLDAMQKLKTTSITAYLTATGLLAEEVKPDGKRAKRPTDMGRKLGISIVLAQGPNGPYNLVVYDRQAQQFILDNLDAIAAINAAPLHENQGQPWSPEEDVWLRQALRMGTKIKDMSAHLKRSPGSIRARIKKLGLEDQPCIGGEKEINQIDSKYRAPFVR